MPTPVDRLRWSVLALGVAALACAVGLDGAAAGSAAVQDWPPFVLVAGLLLVGRAAADDGLFEVGGSLMARGARGGFSLLAGAAVLVALVTAVLNLDTAVAFLTPVLVLAARRQGTDEEPYLYLALFLSNGASLLLPGSNLTNLIVLGEHRITGAVFAAHMAPAWVATSVTVPLVVALFYRRSLARTGRPVAATDRHLVPGLGVAGVAVAVTAIVLLSGGAGALVVAATGVVAVGWRVLSGRTRLDEARRSVDVAVLGGLFGLAVGLGTLGRAWSWPSSLVAHASSWAAAGVGAATSVVVNNLPAASLLAARPVADPYALLVGLNLGPNLAVTGSLSAVLWLQVARGVGARPSALRVSKLGIVVAPLSIAAAVGALSLLR
ncbi:MAG: SLC13 family permease [Acidimicrobiales bacterium]